MGQFDDITAGSKRADQEMTWEDKGFQKWGLRIINFALLVFGVVMLALVGLMVSEDTVDSAVLTPLVVVGGALFLIGVFGIVATFYRWVMKFYFLALFFGTVFCVWLLAYCAANFSKIEDKVKVHFEQNWGELVVGFPEELLNKIPRSCGGNKVNQCDFIGDPTSNNTGFVNPSEPTAAEITACEAVAYEPEEGADDVICVYEAPCGAQAVCVGQYMSGTPGSEVETECDTLAGVQPSTCAGTVTSTGEDCADVYEFLCGGLPASCPETDGCTYAAGGTDVEAACNDHAGCDYYGPEAGAAMCVQETVPSAESIEEDAGRRLQSNTPEPEPFELGSSDDFDAVCWNSIKESMMSNLKTVHVFLIVSVVMLVASMVFCGQTLGFSSCVNGVRKAIDTGMTVAGILLLVMGGVMMSKLDPGETGMLTYPIILLGLLMVVLGLVMGLDIGKKLCDCSVRANGENGEVPKCVKYAVLIYVFLFVVMAVLAFGCIAQEDTVRDKVAEKGQAWLGKFCDADCYAEIQAKSAEGRSPEQVCNPAPSGDAECEESYVWAEPKNLDIACNSTAPNTISQICACPCDVAKGAADVKAATEEYIITNLMGSLNSLGWVCILISMYLFIEVLAHTWTIYRLHIDARLAINEADKPRGV